MMSLKAGVDPSRCHPSILVALLVIESVYREHGRDCVITSLADGRHGPRSWHLRDGVCRAVDVRTKTLAPGEREAIVALIRRNLGRDYDVLLEDAGGANEHLHVEYDPKPRTPPGGTGGAKT